MKTVFAYIQWTSLSLALCLSSCDDDISRFYVPPTSGESPDSTVNIISVDLLDTWVEVVDTTLLYFANSEHRIAFLANDSFNIEIYSFTDAIAADDPCGFQWIHYASGEIVDEDPLITEAASRSESDMLLFRGDYTDSLYVQKEPNCQGEEVFDRLFSMNQKTSDTLAITFYRTNRWGETWETEIDLVRAKD